MELKKLVRKMKSDNKGAALILVLFVALLVSMLVSLLLVATVSNSNMKSVQQIGNRGQNVADSAVEDLTLGLEELADQAMRNAYTRMLSVYSGTVQSARLEFLKQQFCNYIVDLITRNPDDDPADTPSTPTYTELVVHEDGTTETVTQHIVSKQRLELMLKNASGGRVELIVDDKVPTDSDPDAYPIKYRINKDFSVTIIGVKLKYLDDNGFETRVTTDIRFSIPASLVDVSRVSDDIDFKKFAIITDGYLSSINTTNALIRANIYADGGVRMNGGKIVFGESAVAGAGDTEDEQYIVSRNSIKVDNSGQFIVNNTKAAVWVKNIETGTNATGAHSSTPWIDIAGDCYVADDLSLNADGADVKISGSYYGYHSLNSTSSNPNGDASGSSAIIINAKNAQLDLSACPKISIFGKTYLSVPSYYSDTTNPTTPDVALKHSTIMQGESVSFKGVQAAYMVPGNCIKGYNHNPLTVDEFKDLLRAIALDSQTKGISLADNVKNGGIDLEKYVDTTTGETFTIDGTTVTIKEPIKACFVTYYGKKGFGTQLVYLYLKFSSPNKAAEYFTEYYKKYNTAENPKVEKIYEALNIGKILLGSNRVVTGNLIFTNAAGKLQFSGKTKDGSDETLDYADPLVVADEISFTRKYNGLITYLDEYYYTNDTAKSVCDLLIHCKTYNVDGETLNGLEKDVWEGYDGFTPTDDVDAHTNALDIVETEHPFVLITNKNVRLDVSGDKVVVTAGSTPPKSVTPVVKKDGKSYVQGLILTSGNVTLGDGVNFNGMIIACDNPGTGYGVTLNGNATVTSTDFSYKGLGDTSPKYHYNYRYHPTNSEGTLLESYTYETMKDVSDLIKHDKKIYKWFRTYNPAGVEDSDGAGENGAKISFENWTKNN